MAQWTPEQIAAIRAHQRDNAPRKYAAPTGHPAYGVVVDLGGGRTAVIPKHEVDRLSGVVPPMYDPTQDYSFGPDSEQIQKLNALAAAAPAPTGDPTAQQFRPRGVAPPQMGAAPPVVPQGGFSPEANAAAQKHFNQLELLNNLKLADPSMNNNYRPTGGYAASGGPTFSTDEGGGGRISSGGLADTEKLQALNLLAKIAQEGRPQPDFVGDFWREFQDVTQSMPRGADGQALQDIGGVPYSPGMIPTPKALERLAEVQNSTEVGSAANRNLESLYHAGLKATEIKNPGDVARLGKRIPVKDSRDKLAEQIITATPEELPGLLAAAENPATGLRATHLQKIIENMGANAPEAIKNMATEKAAERGDAKKLKLKKEQNAQELLTSRAIGRRIGIDNTELLRQAQSAGLRGDAQLEAQLRQKLGETTAKQLEQLNQARIQQAQGGQGRADMSELDMAKLNLDMAQFMAQLNLQNRAQNTEDAVKAAAVAAGKRDADQQVGAVADPQIKELTPKYGRYAADLVGKYNATKTLNRPMDEFSEEQRNDAMVLTDPVVSKYLTDRDSASVSTADLAVLGDQLSQLSPQTLESLFEGVDKTSNNGWDFKSRFHPAFLPELSRSKTNIQKLEKLRKKMGIVYSPEEEAYLQRLYDSRGARGAVIPRAF